AASRRPADAADARLAGLDHRAPEDRQAAHGPNGSWRRRRGRFPPGTSNDARLRLLGQADINWLDPSPDGERVPSIDASARLPALRLPGWGLGGDHLGATCTAG